MNKQMFKVYSKFIDVVTIGALTAYSLSGLKITFEGWAVGRTILFAISGMWIMLYVCARLDFKKMRGDE